MASARRRRGQPARQVLSREMVLIAYSRQSRDENCLLFRPRDFEISFWTTADLYDNPSILFKNICIPSFGFVAELRPIKVKQEIVK